jgi:phenylacetate-CoA ligase
MDLQRIYKKSPIFVQQWLITMWGYDEHKNRFVGSHDSQLNWLRENISISRERFHETEMELLPGILENAYEKVPAYKKKFDESGIKPADIKSLDDLRKLSPTTKEDIRSDYDSFISRDYEKEKLLRHFTSGSTGSPMAVYRSVDFFQKYNAYISFFREMMGVKLTDPRISFGGKVVVPIDQKKPPFWRFNPAWNQLYMSPYHMSEKNLPVFIERIRKHKPAEILGYTSAITVLARFLVEHEITDINPKVVFTNSEPLREWQRTIMEKAFQCPVREWYSTIEHLFFAFQCSEGNYHFMPGLGIVEILTDGKPAKEGEPGEVYGTTLLKYSSPYIRYKILDSVVPGGDSCKCGLHLPYLTTILGRIDDLIATPDGNYLGMGMLIFQAIPDLREGQLVQEDFEKFTAYLVPGNTWDDSYKEAFIKRFRAMYPYKAELDIQIVESVPRHGMCKAPNMISLINRNDQMIKKSGFKNVKLADSEEKSDS